MATKPKTLSFKRKKKRFPFQVGDSGLKVQGPSHEDGGVKAVTQQGEEVAEIEGGERVFSVEDTKYMENEARRILSLLRTNSQAANEAARALGFKVVEMLVEQEKNQRQQEGNEETGDTDQATEAMNQFANSSDDNNSYSEQPT